MASCFIQNILNEIKKYIFTNNSWNRTKLFEIALVSDQRKPLPQRVAQTLWQGVYIFEDHVIRERELVHVRDDGGFVVVVEGGDAHVQDRVLVADVLNDDEDDESVGQQNISDGLKNTIWKKTIKSVMWTLGSSF